jgi:Ca-activated chloride channel homolog
MGVSALKALHFLHPWRLAALPVLWALLYWLSRRHGLDGKWSQVVDAELLPSLRLSGARGARASSPWWLLVLLWTLATIALAGLSWQREQSATFRAPVDWVLVLDLSPSMAAVDIQPNRVTRARYAIADILDAARDARVALVVFAGEPHTVAPLTTDVATVRALLPPLAPSIMPETGDELAPALEEAGRLMATVASQHAEVVVLTDGVGDPVEALQVVQRLRQDGATVNVVGVGTTGGAPIVDRKGGFVHDSDGRDVVPRLPLEQLQRIASAGGGRYVSVGDVGDLIHTMQADHAYQAGGYEAVGDKQVSTWKNDGVWLLLPLVLLAPLVARRGWL